MRRTVASIAGSTLGWLASKFGWTIAGDLQLCATCLVGALFALTLKPERMARRVAPS